MSVVGGENGPPLTFGAREGVAREVGQENSPPLVFGAREGVVSVVVPSNGPLLAFGQGRSGKGGGTKEQPHSLLGRGRGWRWS